MEPILGFDRIDRQRPEHDRLLHGPGGKQHIVERIGETHRQVQPRGGAKRRRERAEASGDHLSKALPALKIDAPHAADVGSEVARVDELREGRLLEDAALAVELRVARDEGLVNKALMGLGFTDAPVELLFNRIGVYVAMVHILLPFMVLPLYSVMKGISPVYMRAAVSLGCPPFKSFWKVYFPQTLPGIGAGGLLVFILCIGYYVTPALLGGADDQMISYYIAQYTNVNINWGMACALGALLLAAALLLYAAYRRLVKSELSLG